MVTTKTDLRQKSINRKSKVKLPIAPDVDATGKMEIYARFMRHMRLVSHKRTEMKVLCAIQFTADMLDLSDALVSKTLVDLGLLAPRAALPQSYLDFVDDSLLRPGLDFGAQKDAMLTLKRYWNQIGEDRFALSRASSVLKEVEAAHV